MLRAIPSSVVCHVSSFPQKWRYMFVICYFKSTMFPETLVSHTQHTGLEGAPIFGRAWIVAVSDRHAPLHQSSTAKIRCLLE